MRIVSVGGGVCGLLTAMMLANDGHEVTVLERDAQDVPDSIDTAWSAWERNGVAQFHQAHNLFPRVRLILEEELPDVLDAFRRAGAFRFDMVANLPPMITDREPRPIDHKLWSLTGRRSTFEFVVARAAANHPGVDVRRGVHVTGVLTRPPANGGPPHVVGVRTSTGDEYPAELVIDASGRRSRFADWIASAGGRTPIEHAEKGGFSYYTRYFTGDDVPGALGPLVAELGTISILTLPGDNHTWSVTVFCAAGDQPLKALRHAEVFQRVVASSPLQAHWLQGKPLTDVMPMSGVLDRYRRIVVDGAPVVTGLLPVADAWACTNPSAGKGITYGLMHGRLLRDALRASPDDPRLLALEFDERTEAEVTPWYDMQIAGDRKRVAEMEALRDGRDVLASTDELAQQEAMFWSAVPFDADVFRAAMEIVGGLALNTEVFDRPGVMDKAAAAAPPPGKGLALPGPSRAELLALVA